MGSVAFETRKAKQGAAYDPQSGLMIKSHCFYLPYHRASDERRFLVRLTKDDCAGGRVMATEDSPSPEILFPHWQNEYQAALVELDREKLHSGLQPQRPRFSIGFKRYRKALTIKQNGKPLKML
jgi:hypothetical protein